jgi:membrane protein DedA with SNARE-associated domain
MLPGQLFEYVSVFVASALNLNYGLGLSMTYQLNRFELFLLMSTGSIFGISLALLMGAKIRDWWRQKYGKEKEEKPSLTREVWRRYGLLGLAFFTFLIGPFPPVAIALIAGIKKELIFIYLSAGKFFWSAVFAYLGYSHIQKVLALILQ